MNFAGGGNWAYVGGAERDRNIFECCHPGFGNAGNWVRTVAGTEFASGAKQVIPLFTRFFWVAGLPLPVYSALNYIQRLHIWLRFS